MLKQYQRNIYISLALLCFLSPAFADEAQSDISVETITAIEKGKGLFNSICIHCHKTTYEESAIGAPGLQGVLERHDEIWLNKWIKGPEFFAKTDVAARDLIDGNRFGLAMPTLAAMQDESNRLAIIEYLKTLK